MSGILMNILEECQTETRNKIQKRNVKENREKANKDISTLDKTEETLEVKREILKQKIQAIEDNRNADITKHNLDIKTEEELTQMDETEQVAFAQEI